MYPWRDTLTTWAKGTNLKIDALGLITILGVDEIDITIGRLMPSPYLDFLPLLGASVVAGKHFSKKRPGFTLYNVSQGIVTTELAGWFLRWLKAQPFTHIRSIVTWEVEKRPPRWVASLVGLLLIGLPAHGMLIAMTLLADDWWGFANAMAMVLSVAIRWVFVNQNLDGITTNLRIAQEAAEASKYEERYAAYMEAAAKSAADRQKNNIGLAVMDSNAPEVVPPPKSPYEMAKVIVVTEDSKVVTIAAPEYLMRWIFLTTPPTPSSNIWTSVAWITFAVHIVSIGMSALYTQIYTVVLLGLSTMMTAYHVGCDDSTLWKTIRDAWSSEDREEEEPRTCWVGANLKATISTYPAEYSDWSEEVAKAIIYEKSAQNGVETIDQQKSRQGENVADLESLPQKERKIAKKKKVPERRQDVFVWLDMTSSEEENSKVWGLIPRNKEWIKEYEEKKAIHRRRLKSVRNP